MAKTLYSVETFENEMNLLLLAYRSGVDQFVKLAIDVLESFGISQRAISRELGVSHNFVNSVWKHEKHFPMRRLKDFCCLINSVITSEQQPLRQSQGYALGKLKHFVERVLNLRNDLDLEFARTSTRESTTILEKPLLTDLDYNALKVNFTILDGYGKVLESDRWLRDAWNEIEDIQAKCAIPA